VWQDSEAQKSHLTFMKKEATVTQTTQVATTQVIVVGEDAVYAALSASGVGWDLQHQVRTLAQMRDDLGARRLSSESSILVISDSVPAQPGELEALVAWAAPYLHVFVVAWNPVAADALYARIMDQIQASQVGEGESEPKVEGIYLVPADTGTALLEAMREQLEDYLPWPEEYTGDLYQPLSRSVAPVVSVFDRSPVDSPSAAPAPVVVSAPPVAGEVPEAPASPPMRADRMRRRGDSRGAAGQTVTGTPVPGQVTLAVTSSKGGSGKSTTAMLVAGTIAHGSRKAFEAGLIPRPLKVVLVDMDTRDGQVASMIGQYMPTAINIRVEPRWDEATVLRNLVHSDRLEIDCLLAPVRPRSADDVGPEFYRHVIRTLQCTHDVVIMDTSVNYMDPLISTVCLAEATAIMFVTTLVATAVQGMARALNEITGDLESEGMGIPAAKIGVVVNQAMQNVGMDKGQVLEAALGVPIIGMVPMASQDVQLATNYNRMHMLMEHRELGPAYFALAQACMQDTELLPPANWDAPTATSPVTGPAPAPAPGVGVRSGAGPGAGPGVVAGGGGAQQPEPPTSRKRGFFRRR
jgi:cellulose biosynthesis protein BcsQ/sulfur transfer complex TusBCD TusB component (DsrH family)